MPLTIGVGLLFDEVFNNSLRALELAAQEASGNDNGLRQPPHVTIKRPCQVNGHREVQAALRLVETIARKTKPFSVHFGKHATFGNKVVYIQAAQSTELTNLHTELLQAFEKQFGNTTSQFESDRMIYHATVAMDLTPEEFLKARLVVQKDETIMPKQSTVCQLGLFLGMDNDTNWIVIGQWPVGQAE